MKPTHKPWLNSNRKPVCDSILKRISRSWNAETWERYLTWYQKPRKEALVDATAYDLICDGRSESIYQEYGYETDPVLQDYCDLLLRSLPKIEEKVLRLYYLEGLTELQIAIRLKLSKSGAHVIKKRALSRLRSENTDERVGAIRIMRGLISQNENSEPSFGVSFPKDPIRENRIYSPNNWKAELQTIRNKPVRDAIAELPSDQKQIVYSRFWCDQPFSVISRRLGIGINIVHDICDAAVSRIKRRAVELTQIENEVPSCA